MISFLAPPLLLLGMRANAAAAEPASFFNGTHVLLAGNDDITIRSDGLEHGVLVLDYGQSFEGHPTFEVVATSGDTSGFETTFAESRAILESNYMSDGPLQLSAAMNSFRVEKHDVAEAGIFESRLIQGAFRYEKLNLSTAGELQLRNIGVRPTTHTTPLEELPGHFECSDEDLTRIWLAGARTAQLTEIPRGTIPDFWQVSSEGSLVESSLPQPLAVGRASQLTEYELAFDVKALSSEFVFSILSDTIGNGLLIHCDLENGRVYTSNGFTGKIHFSANAHPGHWVSVRAVVAPPNIEVYINNRTALEISQTDYVVGSFGLGAWLGHSAYFRNLRATTPQGDEIYSNDLREPDFLDDFFMGINPLDTIVDGSRRDRIAYAGDLDVSIGVNLASTYAKSFVEGSIDLLGSYHTTEGFFIPNAKIQQEPLRAALPINATGLIGYSFNIITGISTYYEATGKSSLAKKWAPSVVAMLNWADLQVVDGLFTLDDPSLVGDWNYYDPPQTGASSKFNALYAYALQQCQPLLRAAGVDTAVYQTRLEALRKAMNKRLWNAEMGAYVVSDEIRNGLAQDAQAIAILAGVPQSANISAQGVLKSMTRELQTESGPLAFSQGTEEAGFAKKISPFASAYHLRSAFEAKDGATALLLLKSLWAPMADPSNDNYTNTFWETLSPDGSPGLGNPTSLCHGWAAGPTTELSKHVLGVQATRPGFKTWTVEPITLNLDWAKGSIPTEHGNIGINWSFGGSGRDLLYMEVSNHQQGQTRGTVRLPHPLRVALNASLILVNGEPADDSTFHVDAGQKIVIEQKRLND